MLGKLLKQDFRATARIMLPLYAAVPVLGLFTNLITRLCENQNGFLIRAIGALCRERGIAIRVVTGPGYAHRDELVRHIKALGNPLLRFEYATNIMSRMMEGVDLAICSAGRTVYELAHMHIPSIVLAQHEREARHTFARADHGFAYMGIMRKFNAGRLRKVFVELIDEPERRNVLYQRQSRIHFEKNIAKVVSGILKFLKKEKES